MAVEKERVYLDSNGNELLRVQNGADAENVDFNPGNSGMQSTNAEDAIKEAYNHGGGEQVTLDDNVTQSSPNGVKSSGIYAYIQQTVAATGAIIGEYVDYDGITFNLLSKKITFYGGRIVVGKTVIGAGAQTLSMLDFSGANRRVAIFYDGGQFKLSYVEQLSSANLSASAIFIGAYTYYRGTGYEADGLKTFGLTCVRVIPERDKDTWPRLIKTFDFNEPILFDEVTADLALMKEDLGMASTDTLSPSNPSSLTVARIYTLYNNFVTDYPSFVTKTAWGSTDNENYELSYYVIGENQANFDHKAALGRTPTIIIGTGMHGSERASVVGTYFFIRHILKSNDAWAKFIRKNIRIVLLPMINPYGWVHSSRGNGSVADVNRNFNVTISNGFTEKESQLCKAVTDAFPRSACLIDYHGSDSIGHVHSYTNGSKLASIWYSVASELDSLWKETYATEISTFINNGGTFKSNLNGKFIHGADNTDVNNDFSDYGDVVGIPSTTIETVLTMPWETTSMTTACLRCTTQTLAYFVLNLFV